MKRRMKSRSALLKALVDEEDERIRSHQAHRRIFSSGRRIEFDDRAATQAHDLVNRHRGGSKNHHEIDADLI